jgi:hypothetical protein
MRSIRFWQSLVILATFTLVLLVAGVFGFGLAIQHGVVESPDLDVQFYKIHILAYRTDYPECPPTTLCPPQSIVLPPAFYVVWRISEVGSDEQPDSRRSMARRLLVVRLKR